MLSLQITPQNLPSVTSACENSIKYVGRNYLNSYFWIGRPRIRTGMVRDVPTIHMRTTANNNPLCIPNNRLKS